MLISREQKRRAIAECKFMNDTVTTSCVLILEMYRLMSASLIQFKIVGIHIGLYVRSQGTPYTLDVIDERGVVVGVGTA